MCCIYKYTYLSFLPPSLPVSPSISLLSTLFLPLSLPPSLYCLLSVQKYVAELKQAPNPHHKVTGGFHLNSKGIELALRVSRVP